MNLKKNNIIYEDLKDIYQRNINWNQLRNKTILITGAYGMLASYFVYMCIFLNEAYDYGIEIIAAVRSKEKLYKRFGVYADKKYFSIYLKDINKPLEIEGKVDYIVHGAGLASSQYYFEKPIEVMMPNISATMQLLELAVEKNSKSFLQFSSGEIYGTLEKGVTVITEDTYGLVDTLDLRNCYCESKRMAEMLCCAWYAQKKVPVKIARICHTFGPTMDIDSDTRVFSSFVSDVLHNRNIVMKSDGKTKRPFTYIADAVAAYFIILLGGEDGNAYNVCNEQEFLSIREVAEIVIGLYPQAGLKVVRDTSTKKVKNATENEIKFSSKKLQELGWQCHYDTKSGFLRTIEGIKEQREGN